MQMTADRISECPTSIVDALRRPHSHEFVADWRELVIGVFGWQCDDRCIRVPSLTGRPTRSYLPLLNYTDLTPDDACRLARSIENTDYLIRALAPADVSLQPGAPVTLRLNVAGRGEDGVWKDSLDAKCRNQVRKSQRSGLTIRAGRERRLRDDFHALLAGTMHHYGAPLLPRRLFDLLPERFDVSYYVAYHQATPAAAIVAISDHRLVWVPWAASNRSLRRLCPNHLLYWAAISDAIERQADIFDFGRSPYGGPTHRFKRQWGAQPIGLDMLSPKRQNPYGKYRQAQAVWRVLPRTLVDRIGPRLCKYLVDY